MAWDRLGSRLVDFALPTLSLIPEGATGNELVCYAVRDIPAGEEITNDYRDFDRSPDDVSEVD